MFARSIPSITYLYWTRDIGDIGEKWWADCYYRWQCRRFNWYNNSYSLCWRCNYSVKCPVSPPLLPRWHNDGVSVSRIFILICDIPTLETSIIPSDGYFHASSECLHDTTHTSYDIRLWHLFVSENYHLSFAVDVDASVKITYRWTIMAVPWHLCKVKANVTISCTNNWMIMISIAWEVGRLWIILLKYLL